MVAVGLDVLCVMENTYIVFEMTCLPVTVAKLLLLPISQLPYWISDITQRHPILLEIRMSRT